MQKRRNHFDVTNKVDLSDPAAVCDAVCRILSRRYPGTDMGPVHDAFETFTRMYAGILPGFHGCDTWYHDAQHSLDCTLAMARLLDGHERSVGKRSQFGERRARLGVICALFHDSGYIRRWNEPHFHNGAEFTLYHVSRSGDFLAEYLPTIGFAREAEFARRVVHYTGYEIALDKIPVRSAKDRRLGFLLGTADLLAQMSDRCYPEKCLKFLYHEFAACGMAGETIPGVRKPIYKSPEDLLRQTPGFVQKLFAERLDGYFEGARTYMEAHFDSGDPYVGEIMRHLHYIEHVIRTGDLGLLRRRPRSMNSHRFRQVLGIKLARLHLTHKPFIRSSHRVRARRKPGRQRMETYVPV